MTNADAHPLLARQDAEDQIFDNHLFERNYFAHELPASLPQLADASKLQASIAELASQVYPDMDEAQLEIQVIQNLLDILGWTYVYQKSFRVQGREIRPDFILFADNAARDAFLAAPVDDKPIEKILAVWENKAPGIKLDNGKTDKNANPFFQVFDYLLLLRKPFGFMSNGHEAWLIDNREISASKRYLRASLDKLATGAGGAEALRVFLGMFGKDTYAPRPAADTVFATLAKENENRKKASEDDLRNAVYGLNGRESLFEKCGAYIFEKLGEPSREILGDLYANCLYLTFRLLFIVFFEDRHRDMLAKHPGYAEVSLARLYADLPNLPPGGFIGWDRIQHLFSILSKGNANREIPLFNGGLFDAALAPMLNSQRLISNAQLREILDMLYHDAQYLRDFSALSVIHFGRIYESLLEYEFRIADAQTWLVAYKKDGEISEGFFDDYDCKLIQKDAKCVILRPPVAYLQGSLYLTGGKNSRKNSASYYTPQSLSRPLIRAAVDHALQRLKPGESVLRLKVLDSACGSGHLLVETLDYLTTCAIDRLPADEQLALALAEEKKRVGASLAEQYLDGYAIEYDELAILKRILLKRVIYGVDIQPFAVELTRLSLWIETFIFGTPLSFIQHHVKPGNSLFWTPRQRIEAILGLDGQKTSGSLFDQSLTAEFRALKKTVGRLSALADTTPADVRESRQIYSTEFAPELARMNEYFDLLNSADAMALEAEYMASEAFAAKNAKARKRLEAAAAERKEAAASALKNFVRNAQALHDKKDNWQELQEENARYRAAYGFFNWELEFPEVFTQNDASGFDIIISNPPWDKTKFADPDFFSSYRSNYRGMSNAQKAETAANLLSRAYIRQRYDEERKRAFILNGYYKTRYPLNAGAGDGNLFRFFVENNLKFLRPGGTLNYVLPTAFLTDEGSTALRKHIIQKLRPLYFYGFENRKLLFRDVHSCYKFGLMQIELPEKRQPASPAEQVMQTAFCLTSPAELLNPAKIFPYSLADVQATSPKHWAFMEVPTRADLELLKRIYNSGFPVLSETWLDFRNELHATADKRIFHEKRGENAIPLYKGACIWQYDCRYFEHTQNDANRNEYWLAADEFDEHLRKKERGRIINDIGSHLPGDNPQARTKSVLAALKLQKTEELDAFIVPDRNYCRLALRAIASDTNARTIIATLLPPNIGVQHSLWVTAAKHYRLDQTDSRPMVKVEETSLLRLLFAQAFFNSIPFDWLMRCSIAINVSKTYLYRAPMPQPTDAEIMANPIYQRLAMNSLALAAWHAEDAFGKYFAEYGLEEDAKILTDKLADMRKIENDILVASLYGLGKADMERMLQSFKVMNVNNPEYGAALLGEMSGG